MKPKGYTRYWIVAIVCVGCVQAFAEPFAKGLYLGQIPPGSTAKVFAPGLICDTRPNQWESWPSFSTDGNTFCFDRNRRVHITDNTDQGWTKPKRIESIPYHSVSCCLSPDANSLYIRCGPFSKVERRATPLSTRIYSLRRCMRTSEGWSLPQELGPPFSSSGQYGGFSVAADNSIYFWGRKGGLDGRGGFWVAPFVDNTWPRAIKIPVEKGNLNP